MNKTKITIISSINFFINEIPNNSLIVGEMLGFCLNIYKKNGRLLHYNCKKRYNLLKSYSVAYIARKKIKKGFCNEISLLKPIYIKSPDLKLYF